MQARAPTAAPSPPDDGLTRCQHCRTPVFQVRDGLLIIKERHHGQWHTSMFRVSELGKETPPDEHRNLNKSDR